MLTVLKFSSPTCAPCKMYNPIIEGVAESRGDVHLVKVDITENPSLAAKYGVQGVPFTVFQNSEGEVLGGFTGPVNAAKLNKLIDNFVAN